MSDSRPQPPSDDEVREAQDLLRRTVDFLTHCSQDPDAAMASDDPQALIEGLEDLARERFDAPPPSIRRRRSA